MFYMNSAANIIFSPDITAEEVRNVIYDARLGKTAPMSENLEIELGVTKL